MHDCHRLETKEDPDWILDQKKDISGKTGEILIKFVFSLMILYQG